jgi:hypothetical protein
MTGFGANLAAGARVGEGPESTHLGRSPQLFVKGSFGWAGPHSPCCIESVGDRANVVARNSIMTLTFADSWRRDEYTVWIGRGFGSNASSTIRA